MKQKKYKERGWKKLLGFMLTLVVVLALLPVGSITAYAFEITVTVVNDDTNIYLDVEPSDSVENVKAKLAEKTQISIENQILKFGDIELNNNNKTIADYNVQKGAVLTLERKSSTNPSEAEYDIKYSEIRENGSGKAYPVGTRIYMDIKPKMGTDNEDADYFYIDSLEAAVSCGYITVDGDIDGDATLYFTELEIKLQSVITLTESYVDSKGNTIKSGGYWIFNLNNDFGDEFYGVVASSEKEGYKDIKVPTNKLDIVGSAAHTHQWNYTLSEDGRTITVNCTNKDGDCEYRDRIDLTCSIEVNNRTYSGKAYDGVSVTNNITSATGAEPSIKYYLSDGTTLTTESNSSATVDGGAPEYAGKYTAKVTIGDKTVTADFEITKADLTPTVSLTSWVYGQTASRPVVEGNKRNGLVTYYYKARGAEDSTYTEIDSDLDFSKIPLGQYTLKACIEETTNYNAAEATCDFAVTKNSITVMVEMDGWTYGDNAKAPSIAEGSNPGNGAATYTYYIDAACTQKTTSVNGAASNGAVPKNAGIYYVKADVAETDNFAAGSGKASFTIAKKNVTAKVKVKDKSYDGTLTADVEVVISDSALVSGDKLDISGITGTFADKNAGTDKLVTVDYSNQKTTGTDADNYNVTIEKSETITATISKRVVELEWDSNPAYTGEKQSVTATVSNAVAGDSFNLEYTGNTGKDVSDAYIAKVTNLGNDNYTLEGSKTAEQKWSISYLDTDVTVDISKTPDGTNGWYRQDVTVKAPQGYQISEDGKTWTDSFYYKEDGTYTKGYYLKDANGHITDKKVVDFKIDKTAPAGTVKIKEKVFSTFLNKITYGYFLKNNAVITIEGQDVTSDIAKIEYQKVSNGETFDKDGKWTEGNKISVAAKDKAVIYVRLTDKAGNQSIINTDGIVVYADATATAEETFAKNSKEDVTTGIIVNGNTIDSIMVKNGADESAKATKVDSSNYEIKDDKLVLKASYLQTLAVGTYTLTVNYNPYGETFVEGDTPDSSVINFTINKAEGNINKDAEVAPDSPITEAALDSDKSELIAASGIFTAEEKTAIENGADARVWLEISATTNLADADKKKVEAEAKKIMGSDISKVVYFDADLFKSITKDGTTTKSQITEPGTEIEVSVSLPESLVQTDSTILRVYKIIRLHNGEVDSFDAVFDKETGTLTFKTDRFSTYVIAFTDTQLAIGVTLTPNSKTLTKKGETVQLTATVTPDNAANKKVTWTSSDSKVATVDENGLVTAVANGTAIITVTTEDGGKTAAVKITVNISSDDDNNGDNGNNNNDNKNNVADTKKDNQSVTSPQTGDTSNLALWTTLFMASLAGLVSLFVKRRKENGK